MIASDSPLPDASEGYNPCMKARTTKWTVPGMLACATGSLHLAADAAWAQKTASIQEPEGSMMPLAIGVAVVVVVCVPALLNAKRSHLT